MDATQMLIDGVLKGVRSNGKEAQEDKWYDFLETELTFPFKAKIEDSTGGGI